MFTELKNYLASAAPHLLDIITDALAAFDNMGLDTYQDEYMNILMLSDFSDITGPVDEIVKTTLQIQNEILLGHEIVLNPDTTIAIHTLFINALIDIANYNNTDILMSTANLEADPSEVLAELVALVSHKNVDELLPEIDKVGISLIGKIKTIVEDRPLPISDEEIMIKKNYTESLIKFLEFIGKEDLSVVNLIKSGLDTSFNFVLYCNLIIDSISIKSDTDIANELICAALISNDGHDNPISIIQQYIDDYITDINKITSITIKVSDVLMKYNNTTSSQAIS